MYRDCVCDFPIQEVLVLLTVYYISWFLGRLLIQIREMFEVNDAASSGVHGSGTETRCFWTT